MTKQERSLFTALATLAVTLGLFLQSKPVEASDPRLHAVLVSVSTYGDTMGKVSLKQAIPTMRDALKSFSRKAGLQPGITIELWDGAEPFSHEERITLGLEAGKLTDRLPTEKNIIHAIRLVHLGASVGDTVVFFFTGHAFAKAGDQGYPTLIAYEGDRYTNTFDLHDEIIEHLEAKEKVTKLLFIDACQTDPSPDQAYKLKYSTNIGDAISRENITIFFSSESGHPSYPIPGEEIGIFTKHLAKGIAGEADGYVSRHRIVNPDVKDGSLHINDELMPYLKDAINADPHLPKGKLQNPVVTTVSDNSLYWSATNPDVVSFALVQLDPPDKKGGIEADAFRDTLKSKLRHAVESTDSSSTSKIAVANSTEDAISAFDLDVDRSTNKDADNLIRFPEEQRRTLVEPFINTLIRQLPSKTPGIEQGSSHEPDYFILWRYESKSDVREDNPNYLIKWIFLKRKERKIQLFTYPYSLIKSQGDDYMDSYIDKILEILSRFSGAVEMKRTLQVTCFPINGITQDDITGKHQSFNEASTNPTRRLIYLSMHLPQMMSDAARGVPTRKRFLHISPIASERWKNMCQPLFPSDSGHSAKFAGFKKISWSAHLPFLRTQSKPNDYRYFLNGEVHVEEGISGNQPTYKITVKPIVDDVDLSRELKGFKVEMFEVERLKNKSYDPTDKETLRARREAGIALWDKIFENWSGITRIIERRRQASSSKGGEYRE